MELLIIIQLNSMDVHWHISLSHIRPYTSIFKPLQHNTGIAIRWYSNFSMPHSIHNVSFLGVFSGGNITRKNQYFQLMSFLLLNSLSLHIVLERYETRVSNSFKATFSSI